MSKNTGISYEVLTQQIFQAILDQEDVKNIRVKHNAILKGRMTDHQIDVYWEFERACVLYRTLVQAKDWAQTVDQGKLLQFKQVLDDIPGQPRGIFVTRTGYQEGAEKVAITAGILLFELREPSEDDLKGRMGHMTLTATVPAPDISDVQVICDESWLTEERAKRGLLQETTLPFPTAGMTDQFGLVDENGADSGSVRKVLISMFEACGVGDIPTPCSHSFKKPTFLKTGVPGFPVLKLTGIKAKILNLEGEDHKSYSTPEGVVAFILKNVTDNSIKIFTETMKQI